MIKLKERDRMILNALQEDFPLSTTPFLDIAHRLGLEEEEVLHRIKMLYEVGVMRRIGGIMDSRKIGFYSTLCACQVPESQIETVAAIINGYSGVTHNYIRDYQPYNMWFTLTAPSETEAFRIISQIQELAHVSVLIMPTKKIYKIKVSFDMETANEI